MSVYDALLPPGTAAQHCKPRTKFHVTTIQICPLELDLPSGCHLSLAVSSSRRHHLPPLHTLLRRRRFSQRISVLEPSVSSSIPPFPTTLARNP